MKKTSRIIFVLILGTVFVIPSFVLAKVYTKSEVMAILEDTYYQEEYAIETLDCDFDFSTSDMKQWVYSSIDNSTIDDAAVRYLGHKYAGLTGTLTKKNDTYYLLTLTGPKSALNKEYGRITFKGKIKRNDPYGDMKGTITVKRSETDDFSACTAKSSF